MLNLDTHILLYALSDQLKRHERTLLSSRKWSISSIVLWEIFKLQQIGRIELDLEDPEFTAVLSNIRIWPLEIGAFRALKKLNFKNDPANEIIAATSIAFNVPLLTRNSKIKRSRVVPFP